MIETGLSGKVVIVTGAAAGIGKTTAAAFAAEGCRVASWDVTEAEEAGANEMLLKPFDSEQILPILKKYISS